jgi:hypothetical protein
MKSFFRFAYRVIIRLHPHAFRIEFGDEMLWIFEQELDDNASFRLLLDGQGTGAEAES